MSAIHALNKPHPIGLSVSDFLVLSRSGAFDRYGKSELLGGRIYVMNAQHRRHARVKSRLLVELAEALKAVAGLEALAEAAVEIPPHNVPEPDIVITDEAEGDGLIPLASVRLIIEVSDSTLKIDLGKKARLYAGAGVPEYWVVDVEANVIHQLWSPSARAYREKREVALSERVVAETIIGLGVETSGL